MQNNMDLMNFLKDFKKFLFFILLFLIPLFFLPLTPNYLDFPKSYLFSIFVLLALVFWLFEKILQGKLVIKEYKVFYLFLLLIFFSALISSLFSPSFSLSFFGLTSEVGDSLLLLILFSVFSFLLINSFEKKEIPFLVFVFLISGAIASILNLLQMFGIFIFPFDFSKTQSFNTIGTPNSFSIFSTLLLPLSLVLFFKSKEIFKLLFGLISLLFLLNLIFVNFKLSFFVLLIVILLIFVFGFEKQSMGFILVSTFLLIFSIFFFFFPAIFEFFPELPPEILLSFPAQISILKNALSESFKNLFFGTGPSTFIFSFSEHRPEQLNLTPFWGTRFQKGFSTFFDAFLTRGVLGGILLLSFYIFLIFLCLKTLKKGGLSLELALSSSLIGSILFLILYPLNFSLLFSFWVLVSLFLLSVETSKISFNFSLPPKSAILNFFFVLSLLFAFSIIFFQTKIFLGEFYYLKAQAKLQKGNLEETIELLKKASKINNFSDAYLRDLSQVFLTKANLILQDEKIPLEEKRKLANLAIVEGAEAINRAIEIFPFNVANWNVRGFFYRNLIGSERADEIALFSYQRAIELEPTSPYPFGEKARVYILMAQDLKEEKEKKEKLELAINNLNEALKLKPDYAIAHYLMAVAYDQMGKLDLAISKLEETKRFAPGDFGLAFQLGTLYWRKKEIDKAKEEFERALALNPDYQNAKYMLGIVYDAKGEKEKAKEIFKELAKKNPENQELKKILENLEKGLPALQGILSLEPEIGQFPPEISR